MLSMIPALRARLGEAGKVSGYMMLYGTPETVDCYGTWIDPTRKPNLGLLSDSTGQLAPIRLMYEHGQDEDIGRTVIGKVTRLWLDEKGIAFDGELDRTAAHYERIAEELRGGQLGVSSASAGHLANFDTEGRFVDWLVSEVSLTKNPCEARMPAVKLRSKPLDRPPPSSEEGGDRQAETPRTGSRGGERPCGCPEEGETRATIRNGGKQTVLVTERIPMMLTLEMLGLQPSATLDEVFTALTNLLGEAGAKATIAQFMDGESVEEDTPPVAETPVEALPMLSTPRERTDTALLTQMATRMAAMEARMMSAPPSDNPPAAPTRATGSGTISVSEPRAYWNAGTHDLMFVYDVLRSARIAPSEEFRRVLGGRVAEDFTRDRAWTQDRAVRAAFRAGVNPTRANEVMISTANGAGDEWVTTAWSSDLWEKVRNSRIWEAVVSKGMRVVEVPQGAESIYIMGDGTDPTVYTIAQNADLDATSRPSVTVKSSQPGTLRQLLTPGTVAAAITYSDVLAEDSLIPVAAQLNLQMSETMQEHVEKLMINGDTATSATTNINLIDGTPGTGLSAPYYLASNGFLKLPLVTATGQSRDGGSLGVDDYRLTLKLLATAMRTRFENLVFIIDPDTHSASLALSEVATDDVRRTNATISSGVLVNVFGVDVYQSGQMGLANTAGKISATGANNTKGRILCVYAPHWALGWKRQVTIETQRDVLAQANILVGSMRLGFQYRGTDAAALSYNLTV